MLTNSYLHSSYTHTFLCPSLKSCRSSFHSHATCSSILSTVFNHRSLSFIRDFLHITVHSHSVSMLDCLRLSTVCHQCVIYSYGLQVLGQQSSVSPCILCKSRANGPQGVTRLQMQVKRELHMHIFQTHIGLFHLKTHWCALKYVQLWLMCWRF